METIMIPYHNGAMVLKVPAVNLKAVLYPKAGEYQREQIQREIVLEA